MISLFWLLVVCVVVAILFFILGVLIYRNNAKKTEAALVDMTEKYNELRKKFGG